MNEIEVSNVPEAYVEAIIKMHFWGKEETSRNGPVITSPEPVLLTILNPRERVLLDSVRDANPFFHVMEFVWMMTGSKDVRWIEQFNKRFREYADTGTDTIHGAYGHRWRNHFDIDQIRAVADRLNRGCNTRQAVMAMWDPRVDLAKHNDIPCNIQIMFRYDVQRCWLDMTVINRSNDLIWGMLGANAVHMTYLHELISHMARLVMGRYKVFTNNLHVYTEMPKFKEIWKTMVVEDPYADGIIEPEPLLQSDESYEDLVADCEELVDLDIENEPAFSPRTRWMRYVAYPIYALWKTRDVTDLELIQASDWKLACRKWLERRQK